MGRQGPRSPRAAGDSGLSSRAQAPLVVLEPAVDRGVSGEGGSVLHIDCPLWTSQPQQKSHLLPMSRHEEF